MSIMDQLPLTNLRCIWPAPDGKPCHFVTDEERLMRDHVDAHGRLERYGHWWDNCQVCKHPIHLKADWTLRVHGPANRRCAGSGYIGTFMQRCRGGAR